MTEEAVPDSPLSSYFGRAPRDLARITRGVQLLLTALGLLALGRLALAAVYWIQLHDPAVTPADWAWLNGLQGTVGYLDWITLWGTYLVFARWIYLAHTNVRVFGAQGLGSTPLMAVGWYFVPIAQLVKPYLMMRQLSSASQAPGEWRRRACHPVLPWWWGAWIGCMVLGFVHDLFVVRMETFEDYQVYVALEIALSMANAGACVAAGILVAHVATAQRRALDAVTDRTPHPE